ncbi:MAG: hypothetical protein ACOCSD_04095 [Halolamina sp.]
MHLPSRRALLVKSTRRALGVALGLQLFYLIAPSLWPVPPLTVGSVVAIVVVSFLGVWLGVVFSYVAPRPVEKGLPRVIRTALLTVPAMGIGIAIQLVVAGPQGSRAYHVMFALAAWLGSGFIRQEADDADGS